MKISRIISVILTAAIMISAFAAESLAVALQSEENSCMYDLTVNYRERPLGIDTAPVFGWKLSLDGYNRSQSAYRITVADTRENAEAQNGTVWDSGKQAGENNYDIEYKGGALKSQSEYFWTVEVWDENDVSLGVSPAACFETGFIDESDWSAKFIQASKEAEVDIDFSGANWIWLRSGADFSAVPAGDQYFRKTFTVTNDVKKAQIAFTADDKSELYINGEKIGATSAWGSGNGLDVTDKIVNGENTIAMKATNTSSGYAGALCKLELTYSDGSETIVTDSSWRVSSNSSNGWYNTDFDDSTWSAPDQSVAFGGSPWGTTAAVEKPGERVAPIFRKEFSVSKTVKRARAYISGLGLYDFEINGVHADDSVLNSANTDYNDTVLYNVYDITEKISQGVNAVGIMVGHGFFNSIMEGWNWSSADWIDEPMLCMEILLEYDDGTSEKIATDESWKVSLDGPVTADDIYYGETYDARRTIESYSEAGFDETGWNTAVYANAPSGTLTYEDMEPMRRVAEYGAEVSKLSDGTYIVKTPSVMTGWLNIKFNERQDTEITVTYGEKLTSSGKLNMKTESKGATQQDKYICAGKADETYEPRFSYKGFQYVQIDGLENGISADDITAYQINNDITVTGSVETSDKMINSLHEMAVRTMLNNFQGKPTDTPYLEKNGWLGDANVGLEMFNYNFDMNNFMSKFIGDIKDAQKSDGDIPALVPIYNWGPDNVPVWNTIFVNAVKELYDTYGNSTQVEQLYDNLRAFVKKEISQSKNCGWTWYNDQLADWVSPMGGTSSMNYNENPVEGAAICGSAYVYGALGSMAQFADMLGKADDAKEYRDAMSNIYAAFNKKFYKSEQGIYDTGYWNPSYAYKRTKYRQTSNIVPLAFGLVPEEYKQTVVDNLVADIIKKGYHLDTGMVGTKYILPVLAQNGYADVAYKLLTQDTYPSWGYWYSTGASTTHEMWEDTSRSLNHYFLGTYDEYLYKGIGGIDDISDGYKTVTIKPQLAGGLSYANVTVETVRGTLQSNWTREKNNTKYDLIIPVGTTAKVYIPTDHADGVTVNGAAVKSGENGIVSTADDDGYLVLTVGSGSYKINFTDNVTEVARNVESVALDKTELSMSVGDTYALNASVLPETAVCRTVAWSSSDKTVATVDASGNVTAVKAGKAEITATTDDGGKTAVCKVNVSEKADDPTPPNQSDNDNPVGPGNAGAYNGTKVVNGKTVLYQNGKVVTGTKVVTVAGKTYAVVGGYVKTGKTQVVKIGSKSYIVNKSGIVQKGTKNKLVKVGSKSYIVNKSGAIIKSSKNKLVKVGTKSYIVNKKGVVIKGKKNKLVKVGKKKYIVNKKGVVQKNKKSVKVGKKTYKTNKKGVATLKKK